MSLACLPIFSVACGVDVEYLTPEQFSFSGGVRGEFPQVWAHFRAALYGPVWLRHFRSLANEKFTANLGNCEKCLKHWIRCVRIANNHVHLPLDGKGILA